jgi:hypothetical protein
MSKFIKILNYVGNTITVNFMYAQKEKKETQ